MSYATNNALSLEKLDLEGDGVSLGQRWEKWKRSLNIYLEATEITSPIKKRATLLLLGGSGLQEIFYNLPGANVEANENNDVFGIAISKLDEYFTPKQSKVYERHVFRLIKQEEGEKFDKFLIRLRNQAEKCKFDNPKDHLIDQIVEKCLSVDLRKKILTIGDSITLDKIITEANTLEVVNRQMEEYGKQDKQSDVNSIAFKRNENETKNEKKNTIFVNRNKGCSRCGNSKHFANDAKCPAKGKQCHSCGKLGHFRQYCKSGREGTRKRKIDEINRQEEERSSKQPRRRKEVDNIIDKEVDYVFNVNNEANIECVIGGIRTNMLIDSGSKYNLITDKTWNTLKNKGFLYFNQDEKPNKTLFAYGSRTPLEIVASFETTIKINGKEQRANICVIAGGSRNLLGKDSAIHLGVLKLGTSVDQIANEPFPKFKDVMVEIPIDNSIKPISQPYRRVPIPLEEKIE
nr:uncharacterized protein LOC113403790 [Vanessa tameamea]